MNPNYRNRLLYTAAPRRSHLRARRRLLLRSQRNTLLAIAAASVALLLFTYWAAQLATAAAW